LGWANLHYLLVKLIHILLCPNEVIELDGHLLDMDGSVGMEHRLREANSLVVPQREDGVRLLQLLGSAQGELLN